MAALVAKSVCHRASAKQGGGGLGWTVGGVCSSTPSATKQGRGRLPSQLADCRQQAVSGQPVKLGRRRSQLSPPQQHPSRAPRPALPEQRSSPQTGSFSQFPSEKLFVEVLTFLSKPADVSPGPAELGEGTKGKPWKERRCPAPLPDLPPRPPLPSLLEFSQDTEGDQSPGGPRNSKRRSTQL